MVVGPLFSSDDRAPTSISSLSLHDALPISLSSSPWDASPSKSPDAVGGAPRRGDLFLVGGRYPTPMTTGANPRSEEHTSELQSLRHLVCRLLLEKKNHATQVALVERTAHEE